jgi:hypothetical protein
VRLMSVNIHVFLRVYQVETLKTGKRQRKLREFNGSWRELQKNKVLEELEAQFG